jgi:hypothetical protein
MTGPHDSVLGRRKDRVLSMFISQLPAHFDVAKGDVRLNAILVKVDSRTGFARSIARVSVRQEELL